MYITIFGILGLSLLGWLAGRAVEAGIGWWRSKKKTNEGEPDIKLEINSTREMLKVFRLLTVDLKETTEELINSMHKEAVLENELINTRYLSKTKDRAIKTLTENLEKCTRENIRLKNNHGK